MENTIHNDDGTYLLVQATSRTCYTADFIPPQSVFLTTMERMPGLRVSSREVWLEMRFKYLPPTLPPLVHDGDCLLIT